MNFKRKLLSVMYTVTFHWKTNVEFRRCESRNVVQRLLLLTIVCGAPCYQSLQQDKKAVNDCITSNHIAGDLERTSSEASSKRCSELSQAFGGVREPGWTIFSWHTHYRFTDLNLVSKPLLKYWQLVSMSVFLAAFNFSLLVLTIHTYQLNCHTND